MTGTVYFAECAGRIKIGYSAGVASRMRTLETGSPLPIKLLATVPGTKRFERALHDHLSAHRKKGEWFSDCAEVRETMANVLDRGYDAIGFVDARKQSAKPKAIRLTAALLRKAAELIHRSDLRKWLADTTGRGLRTVDCWKAGTRPVGIDDLFRLFETEDGDKYFDVFLDHIPAHTRDLWLESKGFLPRGAVLAERESAKS